MSEVVWWPGELDRVEAGRVLERVMSGERIAGWRDAVGTMRPPGILSLEQADELLARCEAAFTDGPPNKIADVMVPAEMLHELLMVWKVARYSRLQKDRS